MLVLVVGSGVVLAKDIPEVTPEQKLKLATGIDVKTPEADLQLSWTNFKKLRILGNIGADYDQYQYYIVKREYSNGYKYNIYKVGDKWDSIKIVDINNKEITPGDLEKIKVEYIEGLDWSKTIEDRDSDVGWDFTRGDIYDDANTEDSVIRETMFIADGHTETYTKIDNKENGGIYLDSTQLNSFQNFKKIGADEEGYSYYKITHDDEDGNEVNKIIAVEDDGFGYDYVWINEKKDIKSLDDIGTKDTWLGINDQGPGYDWTVAEFYGKYGDNIKEANENYYNYNLRVLRVKELEADKKITEEYANNMISELKAKYNPSVGSYKDQTSALNFNEFDKEFLGIEYDNIEELDTEQDTILVNEETKSYEEQKSEFVKQKSTGKLLDEGGKAHYFVEGKETDRQAYLDYNPLGDKQNLITPTQEVDDSLAKRLGLIKESSETTGDKNFLSGSTESEKEYYYVEFNGVSDVYGDPNTIQEIKQFRGKPGYIIETLKPEQYDFVKKIKQSHKDAEISFNNGLVELKYEDKELMITKTRDTDGNIVEKKVNSEGETFTIIKPKKGDSEIKFNEIPLPPYSTKFKFTKDGLTYNGRPIKRSYVDGDEKWFEYTDDKPGFVRFAGDVVLEKDETGKIDIFVKDKKFSSLTKEQSENMKLDAVNTDFIKNLPSMLKIAKNNRISWDDLLLNEKEETLIFESEEITISYDKSNNNVIFEQGEREKESAYSKITYDENGNVIETAIKKEGENEVTIMKFEKTKDGPDTLIFKDFKYTLEKQKNIEMWCLGPTCINLVDGKVYTRVSAAGKDDIYEPCESKNCEDLAEAIKEHIEKKRVAEGGPNNREKTAIRTFNVLEASQRGIGKLLSLFFDDDEWVGWRNTIDDLFCSTVLFGGKDCWVSEVCDKYGDKHYDGSLIMETPGSNLNPAAHVEGERHDLSFREEGQTKGEYLYKLSYAVKNPDNSGQKIAFIVELRKGRSKPLRLNNETIVVGEGDIHSKAGKKIHVEYMNQSYNKICLVFPGGIQSRKDETINELCNDIVPVLG